MTSEPTKTNGTIQDSEKTAARDQPIVRLAWEIRSFIRRHASRDECESILQKADEVAKAWDEIQLIINAMIDLADEWNARAEKVEGEWYNDAQSLRQCADDLMALIYCPSCGDKVGSMQPRCVECRRPFHCASCGAGYDDGNFCYVCRARVNTKEVTLAYSAPEEDKPLMPPWHKD